MTLTERLRSFYKIAKAFYKMYRESPETTLLAISTCTNLFNKQNPYLLASLSFGGLWI
jgi:hypothetical protein